MLPILGVDKELDVVVSESSLFVLNDECCLLFFLHLLKRDRHRVVNADVCFRFNVETAGGK